MAGTDNSTDVTLVSVTNNYLSISGQAITAGTVPHTLGGTGLTSLGSAGQVLKVNDGEDGLEFELFLVVVVGILLPLLLVVD